MYVIIIFHKVHANLLIKSFLCDDFSSISLLLFDLMLPENFLADLYEDSPDSCWLLFSFVLL
jgi:hypothetical protein